MRKVKWIVLSMVTVLFLVSPYVNAEYVANDKEVLRGIENIGVVIEKLPRKAKKLGITKNNLRRDVELKLQSAGIAVITPDGLNADPEIPFLLVTIILGRSESTFIYAVLIGLNEKVHLKRDPKIISYAMPWWRIIKQEHIGKKGMEREVRNTLEYLINEFIKDHRSVNPRKPRKTQEGK